MYAGLRCWAPANRLGSQVVLLAGWSTFLGPAAASSLSTFLGPAAASSLLLSVDVPGSCSSILSRRRSWVLWLHPLCQPLTVSQTSPLI